MELSSATSSSASTRSASCSPAPGGDTEEDINSSLMAISLQPEQEVSQATKARSAASPFDEEDELEKIIPEAAPPPDADAPREQSRPVQVTRAVTTRPPPAKPPRPADPPPGNWYDAEFVLPCFGKQEGEAAAAESSTACYAAVPVQPPWSQGPPPPTVLTSTQWTMLQAHYQRFQPLLVSRHTGAAYTWRG